MSDTSDEIVFDDTWNCDDDQVVPENGNVTYKDLDDVAEEEDFTAVQRGTINSTEYRIFLKDATGPISIFHDIPLYVDKKNDIHNMVVLAPRWTNAKMQISTKETLNPIRHEHRAGTLRYVPNCFPYHGYIGNMGILPQTWNTPTSLDDGTGNKGDNMPMEVIEIGTRLAKRGEVLKVKVLALVAIIDAVSWKALAIDINDPVAQEINNYNDVRTHFPGLVGAIIRWFRMYQIPDGKPNVELCCVDEIVPGIDTARFIIKELHKSWKFLINRQVDTRGISCANRSKNFSHICKAEAEDTVKAVPPLAKPLPIPEMVDKWLFVQLSYKK